MIEPLFETNLTLAKRSLIAFHDFIALTCVAAICSMALIEPAYAYVDPSVMTYTIQALAGVAVALGAVAGVAFRRTRKVLFKMLKIDENRGKTAEQDILRLAKDDIQAHKDADDQVHALTAAKTTSDLFPLSWKNRLIYALISAFFFVFTLLIATPYELIGGASDSLLFGLSETWAPIAVAGIILWIVLSIVLSLLRGKAFNVAIVVLISLSLLCYLQALFGNSKLPPADGAAIDWYNYTKITLLNGLSWFVGILAIALFFLKKPVLCRNALCVLAVCLSIVQAIGIGSLFANQASMGRAAQNETQYLTEEGLFNISDKSNVVVFLLDWYDNATLNTNVENHPDLLDEMTGFTYYRDVSGTIAPTRYALPWILTAQFIQHDETYSHYLSTLYDRSTFLSDLKNTGYTVGLFTDTFGANDNEAATGFEFAAEHAFNIHPITSTNINGAATVLAMYKASCYRNFPWFLKRFFWFYTDEINQAMASSDNGEITPEKTVYVMNDARYYEKLKQTQLSINEDIIGSFRLIHLNGIHHPYTLNENGELVPGGNESTKENQGVGVMKIVSEYLRQLKSLGVYDKTTIIITCDHGMWRWEDDPLQTPNSPIMLVKPSNEGERQNAPISYSNAPISQFDLHASIMKAITGDGSKYGTAFDEVDEYSPRTRLYVHPTVEVPYDSEFIEYEIDGYALDFDNWHTTGKVWSCDE